MGDLAEDFVNPEHENILLLFCRRAAVREVITLPEIASEFVRRFEDGESIEIEPRVWVNE
jgi:hypothetical protein